jgi:hypothetical protein
MPSERLLTEMGKYNEELVKAGIMLAGEGLHPSSKAKRVRFAEGKSVIEIRRVFEADDFGKEFTPELRAQEERLLAEVERQRKS